MVEELTWDANSTAASEPFFVDLTVMVNRVVYESVVLSYRNIFFSSESAFVNLEKAFDRVPRKFLCWAMRKLEVD